jgi:hypothetical protein
MARRYELDEQQWARIAETSAPLPAAMPVNVWAVACGRFSE